MSRSKLAAACSLAAAIAAAAPATAQGLAVTHYTGALVIKAGDETVGEIGVSGAPGGDKDEACAKSALDKAAGQLK